ASRPASKPNASRPAGTTTTCYDLLSSEDAIALARFFTARLRLDSVRTISRFLGGPPRGMDMTRCTSRCYLRFSSFIALFVVAHSSVGLAAANVRMEVRACGKAEAAIIFGKSIEGCVIYNVATQESKLEVSFCSGLKIGAGAKALIGE